eukprot:6653097-Pyramimonas_sp.AAC.1
MGRRKGQRAQRPSPSPPPRPSRSVTRDPRRHRDSSHSCSPGRSASRNRGERSAMASDTSSSIRGVTPRDA